MKPGAFRHRAKGQASDVLRKPAEVKALCERLGIWDGVVRDLRGGSKGAVFVGGWMIGYGRDGLIAARMRSQADAEAMNRQLANAFGPPEWVITFQGRTPPCRAAASTSLFDG